MSALATLETRLRRDRDLGALGQSHSHRATREDSLGLLKGRDAISAAWVREDAASIEVTADLGDMIAFRVDGWTGHRWVWRQDGRILREVAVEDRGIAKMAAAAHLPLGELRSGEGQYFAPDAALLPAGFPADAREAANRLQSAWNGRAFNLYDQAWLPALVRQLPDATFTFEHAIVGEAHIALLWRVHGHHAGGQRIRLIGSSVLSGEDDDTVIDAAAVAAQIAQPCLSYALPDQP